jgi:hypothetical protein
MASRPVPVRGPRSEANGHKDLPEALAEDKTEGHYHKQRGNAPKNLNQGRKGRIDTSTVVAGPSPDGDTHEHGNSDGDKADRKGYPRTQKQSARNVAAVAVGAQPVDCAVGRRVAHGLGAFGQVHFIGPRAWIRTQRIGEHRQQQPKPQNECPGAAKRMAPKSS